MSNLWSSNPAYIAIKKTDSVPRKVNSIAVDFTLDHRWVTWVDIVDAGVMRNAVAHPSIYNNYINHC